MIPCLRGDEARVDVGAKAKTLVDDVEIQRNGVKTNWRSCATLER